MPIRPSAHPLRLVVSAWVVARVAKWGVTVAVLTLAHELGGAAYVSVAIAGRLAPSAVAVPLLSGVADRIPRRRFLRVTVTLRAMLLLMLAALVSADADPLLLLGVVVVQSLLSNLYRPTHIAMLPTLAETPTGLARANATTSGGDFLALAVGSVLAGAGAAALGFEVVFASAAALLLLVAAGLARAPDVRRAEVRDDVRSERVGDGLRLLRSRPELRRLTWQLLMSRVADGALDVLLVVLALEVLLVGRTGVGVLNGLWGAGGLVTALLVARVGRGLDGRSLLGGIAVAAVALVTLGLVPDVAVTPVLLAYGAGMLLVEVGVVVLTQRLASEEVLGGVFGLQESVTTLGNTVGALLAPLLVAALGPSRAVLAVGVGVGVGSLLGGRVWRIRGAGVAAPPDRYADLRRLPMFAGMPVATVETLALRADEVALDAGEVLVRLGDPGDAMYVVREGAMSVDVPDAPRGRLGRGDVVGEVALLHDRPRTATVTAEAPTRLLRLDRADFLTAMDGHDRSRGLADELARDRLDADQQRREADGREDDDTTPEHDEDAQDDVG